LIQKIDFHPKESTRKPPISGPAAMPIPLTAAHQPIARARSEGAVKTLVTMARATGVIIDPPTA
jgi:hypothetical protein